MMPTEPQLQGAAERMREAFAHMHRTWAEADQIDDTRDRVLADYQRLFTPESVATITEEEFRGFLMFRNNQHWHSLARLGSKICADMDRLREALGILVDESTPIIERLEALRPHGKEAMVPNLGRAVITPILLVIAPDKYGVWNNTSVAGLRALDVFPEFARGTPFAERYVAVNDVLKELARRTLVDLWTLDILHWAALEQDGDEDSDGERDELEPSPEVRFHLEKYLHEFMRDNWERLELGQQWSLYEEDGRQAGFEYDTAEVGRIDLLARHGTEPRWLVIELKRNHAADTTVGQVLRYMGWVEENLAAGDETVEGLIVAHTADERIRYALKGTPNVELKLYEVGFGLRGPENGGQE